MDDVGLQRAIFNSLQSMRGPPPAPRAAPIRPRPAARDIAPTIPSSNRGDGFSQNYRAPGRRNQLEREGIQPTRGAGQGTGPTRSVSSTVTRSPAAVSAVQRLAREYDEMANTTSNAAPLALPLPPRSHHDRLHGWQEMTAGGRSQAQNQQQNHILLVTEEAIVDHTNTFAGPAAHMVLRTDPIDAPPLSAGGNGGNAATAGSFSSRGSAHHVRMMLKSLTGTGRYCTLAIGLTHTPPEHCTSFVAVSVHYEFTGAVFVSVDEWRGVRDAEMPGNIFASLERVNVIERPQQVKPKRDGLDIRVPFTCRAFDVIVNDQLLFKGVTGADLGPEHNHHVYVGLVGCGGRFSAKHVEIGDIASFGQGSAPPSTAAGGRRDYTPPPVSRGPSTGSTATTAAGGGLRKKASSQPGAAGRPSGGGNAPNANKQGGPSSASSADYDNPFIQMIESEIIDRSPNVQWEDVAGVTEAKALLNEAVVLPLLVPELFTGVRTPWKGVLLYGPPGTGKTMLAKAVATCAKTTFYSISASTLLSRYHGESEKIVKALFQSARAHAPATIFFDEIDALMSRRGGQNEHEASRRLKAEMLQQIDGVSSDAASGIVILATTNTPWDLDEAMRRRLEKRIYIPLPDFQGRLDLLRNQGAKLALGPLVDLEAIAKKADGYSGADLNQVCRDAAMMPMRRLIADKSPQQIAEMKQRGALTVPPVTHEDFAQALAKINPSVSQKELHNYEQWTSEFASM